MGHNRIYNLYFHVIDVYLANKRPSACVDRHVSRQVVMGVEHFSAMIACKRLNRCDRGDSLRQFLGAGPWQNGLGCGESPERHLM